MKIGVLALQGAFSEHISAIKRLRVDASPVRLIIELNGLDGLIIPGGESTSILRLMQGFGFVRPLRELAKSGFPILGTCAGMVCLAKKVSHHDMETLAVMDIVVKRNASGRQMDSFETELPISALGNKPFPAVFIRAPFITEADPKVEVLAKLPSGIAVACRQGNLIATAFHPELTYDLRLHSYFLGIVTKKLSGIPGNKYEQHQAVLRYHDSES